MLTITPNILTFKECEEIISNCKNIVQPTLVFTPKGPKLDSTRTAEGIFIYENPPVIQKVKNIVSQLTNLPIENQTPPHIVRYKTGGEYKEHVDYLDVERGKNRKHSCLFYLNENMEGGGTFFPKLKLNINPTTGTLVKWDNLYSDGSPNPNSTHSGMPVIKGEKWILVIWVNE